MIFILPAEMLPGDVLMGYQDKITNHFYVRSVAYKVPRLVLTIPSAVQVHQVEPGMFTQVVTKVIGVQLTMHGINEFEYNSEMTYMVVRSV